MTDYVTSWREIIGQLLGDGWKDSEFAVLKDTNKIKPHIYLRFDDDTISTIHILPHVGEGLYDFEKNLDVYDKLPDTWKSCVKQLKGDNCDFIRFQNKMQLKNFIYELIDAGYVNDDGEDCVGIEAIRLHGKKLHELWLV